MIKRVNLIIINNKEVERLPIISAEPIQKNCYRITIAMGSGIMENIVVDNNGIYSVYYITESKSVKRTGKILNIVNNRAQPHKSYIVFDCTDDNSSKRERIHFCHIQNIIDVTPNDAYRIAVDHGFVGTVEDWLQSLVGDVGKSAYEIALDNGFVGTEEEWVASLKGERGFSAYDIAIQNGFEGTEEEWLNSLHGLNAYQLAVRNGYEGTEEEWMTMYGDTTILDQKVTHISGSLHWKSEM